MKTITEMTTAELVAEYNALTGKSIKKFSSRAAGEKQVLAAREAAPKKTEKVVTYPVKDQTKFHIVDGQEHCPHCGTTEVFAGVGTDKGVQHEDKVFGCHHCGWEVDLRKPKKINPVRSAGISNSWNDPEVAAKRAQRDNVSVEGIGQFRSVREAFDKIGLPMNVHIIFRMALKAEGKKTFEHNGTKYKFKTIKQESLA